MFGKSTPQSIIKISIVELKNLSNDDLKKCLASQIYIEDWKGECGKCGFVVTQDYYTKNCIEKQHAQRMQSF